MDIVTLAAAMAYTKKTADALGAVKGAPCTITAIEPIAGGHKITFEWKSTSGQIETDTLDIMDGAEGQQGQTGPEGPAGPAGVSPSITIEQITGGHRVIITDAQHPQGQSFDVMDGSGGSGIPAGGRLDQVLAKRSSTDGDSDWQQIGFKRYEDKYCSYWLASNTQEYSNVYGSLDEYGADFYGLIYDVSNGQDYGRLVFLDGLLNGHSGMALYLPTERNMNHKLGLKQDKLTAGDNITLTPQQDGTTRIDASIGGGGGNANFDIGTIPLGGSGAYEVSAILSNSDSERVQALYSRGANGELPEWFSMFVNSGLGSDTFHIATKEYADTKQEELVSGTNIKTVNGNSLLGGGDLTIAGGSAVIFDASQNILASELNAAYAKGPIYLKYNGKFHPVVSVTEEGSNYYIGTTSGSGRGMTFYFDYYGTYLEPTSRVDTLDLYGDLNVPIGGTTATIKRNLSQVQLIGSGDTVQYKVKGGNYAEQTFELATTKYVQDNAGVNFEVGAEKWYGTYTEGGVTYQVYSKILDIGALPATAGVTNYPHGITGIKQILQISGFTNDGFVMNAPRQNAQDNISIYQAQKSGNIAIEVGKDRSNKNGFVMLIYAKNN